MIKGMLVYLSGAIDGTPNSAELFSVAAAEVMNLWHTPINPFNISAWQHPYDCPVGYTEGKGHSSACWLRGDLSVLLQCEGIYRLRNWEFSRGARLENDVALFSGLKIFDQEARPGSPRYLERSLYFHNERALQQQEDDRTRWANANDPRRLLHAALEKNHA